MFINLSNHISEKWSEKQLEAAKKYGEIIDIGFPAVDPMGDSDYIDELVEEYYSKLAEYDNPVVMVQGEFTFTYRMIQRLKKAGIKVVASCSERRSVEVVKENGQVERNSVFEFVRFREY